MAAAEPSAIERHINRSEIQAAKDVWCTEGVKLLKFGSHTPHERTFKIDLAKHRLSWDSRRGKTVDVGVVSSIILGQTTASFAKRKKKYGHLERLSLSIAYDVGDGKDTLDVAFADYQEDQFMVFQNALREIVDECKRRLALNKQDAYLQRQWRRADKDKSGQLSKTEIFQLMDMINMNTSRKSAEKLFKAVDDDNSGELSYDEFKELLQRIGFRPELQDLWQHMQQLCAQHATDIGFEWLDYDNTTEAINIEQTIDSAEILPFEVYAFFKRIIQGEDISEEKLRHSLALIDPQQDGNGICFAALCNYLVSEENDVMDPSSRTMKVSDMSHSLSSYWIASSHNTYLEGDQLRSSSTTRRYISDLVDGCRCVELDCWDGDNGQPVIFHGFTLTSKISFESVIIAISRNAFVSSPYPVILSLENHCSIEQQERMAEIIKDHFGDKLACPDLLENGMLPSPEDLKYKILLKGKRLKAQEHAAEEDGRVGEVEEDDDDDDLDQKDAIQSAQKGKGGEQAEAAKSRPKRRGSVAGFTAFLMGAKEEKKAKIAKSLSDITFLSGVKFSSFEQSATSDAANEMSSFSEPKTEKLLGASSGEWAEYNKRQLSRIYPAGSRVNSSNYNPVPSWCVGAQIVALNWQTPGLEMQLNAGRFDQNGNCGYVLKPPFLRDPSIPFDTAVGPFPNPMALTITILSGGQLPKPDAATHGEIIDPYVELKIHGVESDEASIKTSTVDDNGFNPIWNETFTFDINCPELAFLHFTVYDNDFGVSADDFIATRAVPINCLRSGIRSVKLTGLRSNAGEFQFCNLLVQIHVQPKNVQEEAPPGLWHSISSGRLSVM